MKIIKENVLTEKIIIVSENGKYQGFLSED